MNVYQRFKEYVYTWKLGETSITFSFNLTILLVQKLGRPWRMTVNYQNLIINPQEDFEQWKDQDLKKSHKEKTLPAKEDKN